MMIKICGMTRQQDLDCASKAGVDFCGFIFHSKSPRYIAPEKVSTLQSGTMKRVGVFTHDDADVIKRIMDLARLDFAQLHGGQSIDTAQKIGPDKIIRVLWPQKYASISGLEKEAAGYADSCAAFLLDAGIKGGGSGIAMNWNELRGINLKKPWFLAGGLSDKNVLEARGICNPAGMDFNSGLEDAPGIKNETRIKQAVKRLRG